MTGKPATDPAISTRPDDLEAAYRRSALQIISAYHHFVRHGTQPPGELHPSRDVGHSEINAAGIWKHALEIGQDEHLGLRAGVALAQHISSDFLATVAVNSMSVGEALENLCRYHALYSSPPHPEFEKLGDGARVTLQMPAGEPGGESDGEIDRDVHRHMSESLFAAIVTTLSTVCRQGVYPTRVRFSWPAPDDTARHQAIFRATPQFAANDCSMAFSASTLKTTIPFADPSLLSTLTGHADRRLDAVRQNESWGDRVRSVVSQSAPSVDIRAVAASLCIGPRTLQQRLQSEGTTFQNIIRDVKLTMARQLMTDGALPLAEIALLLGYSEQSAFNHAFKRWTGLTPKQYRNRQQ
ncbi:AraC family transcriptional regulator ligand-binding domain-containing protein [Wenzhouxiangella sp. AB-CW3]|uniref:AraC family transcriptional regulator n=1 Tax=Wenzhouxiangella sp. AB-CW3 TaxID=2771012 RepID=UPI00168A7FE0|nr:AraC family transcriptional regulator [Wenzhouxiangella sp. AB-CW3]QOC24054.1 AraC family transcriptional regulator ligand-binding domain-containing protein [Wenzhouxiangella sp. AB-CW3]